MININDDNESEKLYSDANVILARLTQSDSVEQVLQFNSHKDKILNDLQNRLANVTLEPMRHIEITLSKYILLNPVLDTLTQICTIISPAIGEIMSSFKSFTVAYLREIYEASVDLSTMVAVAGKELELLRSERSSLHEQLNEKILSTTLLTKVRLIIN